MKKIATFLAAAALSCGLASAQECLYLVGNPTGWATPDEGNAYIYDNYRLLPDGNGRYVGQFQIGAGNYFRFYSALTGWDNDSFGPRESDGDNVEVVFEEDAYSSLLVAGKGSWCTSDDFEPQEVLMYVNLEEKTVEFLLNAEMPDLPDPDQPDTPAEPVENTFTFADNGYEDGQAVAFVMGNDLDITAFGATYAADTKSLNVPADTPIELCSRYETLGFKSIVVTFAADDVTFGDNVTVETEKSLVPDVPVVPMSRADETANWTVTTNGNISTWEATNADNLIVRFTAPAEVKITSIEARLEAPTTEPDTPDNPDDAIDTVVTDSNATAVYFTLQGVRVASPAKGQIVIERRGNTVTKRVF